MQLAINAFQIKPTKMSSKFLTWHKKPFFLCRFRKYSYLLEYIYMFIINDSIRTLDVNKQYVI